MKSALAALALFAVSLPAAAETFYVTDVLTTPLRSSPVNDAKTVGTGLQSGNAVDVVQRSPDGKWARVRTPQGEGWVQAHLLQKEPGARGLLEELQSRHDALAREHRAAQERLTVLEADKQALVASIGQAHQERDTALQQLAELRIGAAGPQQISDNNRALATELGVLKVEREKLAAEVARLADDQRADFLLYGGLVVFGGLVAGWLMARQAGRRSSGW